MGLCYLMLGSNLGDRAINLERSRLLLSDLVGDILEESSIYESEPWGYDDSQSYFNQALCMETYVSPKELLKVCLSIETKLGRKRTIDTYEPRPIDIDVLFYDSQVLNSEELVLPHPRIAERKFVLEPLNEIAPKLNHPVLGKSIEELLLKCSDNCWVRKF